MVADPRFVTGRAGWLDDDQVEANREAWPIGRVEPAPGGVTEMRLLAMVDRLLRQAELASVPPADLDDDQLGGRTAIDGDHVDLGAADPDLASQDRPPGGFQPARDELLGGIAGLLHRGPHPRIIVSLSSPRVRCR